MVTVKVKVMMGVVKKGLDSHQFDGHTVHFLVFSHDFAFGQDVTEIDPIEVAVSLVGASALMGMEVVEPRRGYSMMPEGIVSCSLLTFITPY